MNLLEFDKRRKRLFFILCLVLGLFVSAMFAIVDYFEREPFELLVDVMIIAVLIISYGLDRLSGKDMPVYRLGLSLVTLCLLYGVILGKGAGTILYWIYGLPVLFHFFLGQREGVIWSFVLMVILGVYFILPSVGGTYTYETDVSWRFMVALLFVTIIAYGLEAARARYSLLLTEKHASLLVEKRCLEEALAKVKTLTGLLPICAVCKKIRDDQGYWKSVESYIHDHSEATMSHGICPECTRRLYPHLL